MNWLRDLAEACKEAETPDSFIFWSGIATISAVVSNNVYMNRKGLYHLRPNVIVMLMAKSGLGKGFPINISKKLVRLTQATRVLAGRASIQAIVQELATSQSRENGRAPFKDSRGYLVSGEFSTALIADADALTILTDLYDCHWNEEWENKLKHSGTEKIIKPNLTILGGSSPAHFFDSIPDVNIFGGFIGRMLIVYEEKRSKVNDLISDVYGEAIEEVSFPYETLVVHLNNIYQDTMGDPYGKKFQWTRPAANIWSKWYSPFRDKEVDDKTGYNQRLPDHALKVAMCLSLAEATDLIIREGHIEEAIERVQELGFSTKRVSEGKGKDPLGPQAKIILDLLISAKDYTLLRSVMLKKGYGDFDSTTLDRIVDSMFVEVGWIEKERVQYEKRGVTVFDWQYKLTQEAINNYKRNLNEPKI